MIEKWKIETRKVSDLIPNKDNPRIITKENFERLKSKIKRLGFHNPIKLKHDGTILGGNQRHKALLEQCPLDFEIPVMIPPRKMTQDEYDEIIITDNISDGEWDIDKLANEWDEERLIEWGIEESWLPKATNNDEEENENGYTKKIESPIYEPNQKKPLINELFSTEKTKELIGKIAKANLENDIKEFLLLAAQRHTVFKYDKIADYYAHSDKEIQDLMQDSALVIIDFDKAIELGFVQMTKEIAAVYETE